MERAHKIPGLAFGKPFAVNWDNLELVLRFISIIPMCINTNQTRNFY